MERNTHIIHQLLQEYGQNSSQHIGPRKWRKKIRGVISSTRLMQIDYILCLTIGHALFEYLGVPIFKGKPIRRHLQHISNKFIAKLPNWKSPLLSRMGRIHMVKSIIHGILFYSTRIYELLSCLLSMMDTWIRNFVWNSSIDKGN